ncbi:hypothetical protein ACOME3_010563, partial [Neoechinorhynchus agilis]
AVGWIFGICLMKKESIGSIGIHYKTCAKNPEKARALFDGDKVENIAPLAGKGGLVIANTEPEGPVECPEYPLQQNDNNIQRREPQQIEFEDKTSSNAPKNHRQQFEINDSLRLSRNVRNASSEPSELVYNIDSDAPLVCPVCG